MTGSSMTTGCDVIKRHVTRRDSLGRVRCAHAQQEVAQYLHNCVLFTGSDVIKRHVIPKGSLGRVGCVHAQPEVGGVLPIRESFERK